MMSSCKFTHQWQVLLGEVMGGMVQQTLLQMSECIGALGLRHNTQVMPS